MSSEKSLFHAKLQHQVDQLAVKINSMKGLEKQCCFCHTLLVLLCFFIVFTLILNCRNLFTCFIICLLPFLPIECMLQKSQGFVLFRQNLNYTRFAVFRFYNSDGKYILVERMIIILVRSYCLSISFKSLDIILRLHFSFILLVS